MRDMPWGVEIEAGYLRVCRVAGRAGRIRLAARHCVALAPGALRPALKDANVKDAAAVRTAVIEACRAVGCRGWVGVALPDAAFSLRSLLTEAVPAARADARRFLAWQARELLPFPPDEARVDYLPPFPGPEGRLRVPCLFAREQVIREYEALLEGAGLRAARIDARSVCLAQAGGSHPPAGASGLLALLEDRSTLLVMQDGRPRFWRNLPYGRTEWAGGGRLRALRELADSLAFCEAEGIPPLGGLAVGGDDGTGRDLLSALGEWLGLPVRPLEVPVRDAERVEPWGAAMGAALSPW
jgi:Tfp pilus assembly PilM family ATPase